MARSHTCPACTSELGKIRALPDPIYALPIVVCPTCATACVRRKHTDIEFWRTVRRTIWGVRRVLYTLAAALVVVLFTTGIATSGEELVHDGRATISPLTFAFAGDAVLLLTLTLAMMLFATVARVLTSHTRLWVTSCVLVLASATATFADQIVYIIAITIGGRSGNQLAAEIVPQAMGARVFFFALASAAIIAASLLAHLLRPVERFLERTKSRRTRKKLNNRTRQQD